MMGNNNNLIFWLLMLVGMIGCLFPLVSCQSESQNQTLLRQQDFSPFISRYCGQDAVITNVSTTESERQRVDECETVLPVAERQTTQACIRLCFPGETNMLTACYFVMPRYQQHMSDCFRSGLFRRRNRNAAQLKEMEDMEKQLEQCVSRLQEQIEPK